VRGRLPLAVSLALAAAAAAAADQSPQPFEPSIVEIRLNDQEHGPTLIVLGALMFAAMLGGVYIAQEEKE